MTAGAPLELPAPLGEAGISFRPAGEADDAFLRRLYRLTRWEEFAPTGWPDEVKIGFLDQQFDFQQRHYRMAFPDAEYCVVLRHAEPIGRLTLDRSRPRLHLVEISLLPEWRGRGVGTTLLEAVQQEVRAGRHESVELQVVTTNPARRLYARLGFREIVAEEEFPGLYVEMRWPLS